jgi:hypothetical protein
MHILLDSEYLDRNFIGYTLGRGEATIRIGKKWGRLNKQKMVAVLESYFLPIPKEYERVLYQTGLVKKGMEFHLGKQEVIV